MSAGLPVLAVDVGCVELAAHSVRSMECTNGIGQNIRLYAVNAENSSLSYRDLESPARILGILRTNEVCSLILQVKRGGEE